MQPKRLAVHRPTLAIGIGLLVLAAITGRDAYGMDIRAVYGLGADAASYFMAAFLAVLGLAHLGAALKPGIEPDKADMTAVFWVAAGLVGLIGSIWLGGGFILGSTLLFALTARGFGRRALVMDLAIGLFLGVAIFLLFNKLLTLSLPSGPLERLF